MATLADAVAMVQRLGAELRNTAAEARQAADDIQAYGTAREAVEARSSSSGIQNARTGTPTSIGATDLGDPRNAEEQAARMIASIEAAKRR